MSVQVKLVAEYAVPLGDQKLRYLSGKATSEGCNVLASVNKGPRRKPAVTDVFRDRVRLVEACAQRVIIGVFSSVPSPMGAPLLARHSIVDQMGLLFGIVWDGEIFRRRFQKTLSWATSSTAVASQASARVFAGKLPHCKPAALARPAGSTPHFPARVRLMIPVVES